MDEFRIITKERNEILMVEALNEELTKYRLPGAMSWKASTDLGKMLFHHFAGEGYDIWFSNYLMKQDTILMGKSDRSVLELHTHFTNSFQSIWNGFNEEGRFDRQYDLTYVPDVDTTGIFRKGLHYDTFDIHFHKEMLHPYSSYSPRLMQFLENVEKGKPARLCNIVRLLTPEMEECIRGILRYAYHDGLAERFIKGRVDELLILLVHHLSLLDKLPEPDPEERRKAGEVYKIIISDFSVYDSVETLARKVCTTEAKLQMAFKQVYGTTVGKFSREERLKKAHEVLMNTNEMLLTVALMVGYNDVGNFSTAFKQFFGYSPGHIRKRMKRQ